MSDRQWHQASLSVEAGGLGISQVISPVLPAFLAFAAGTCSLQSFVLSKVQTNDNAQFEAIHSTGARTVKWHTYTKVLSTNNYTGINHLFNKLLLVSKPPSLMPTIKHASKPSMHHMQVTGYLHRNWMMRKGESQFDLGLGKSICEAHNCPCEHTHCSSLCCSSGPGRFSQHAILNN